MQSDISFGNSLTVHWWYMMSCIIRWNVVSRMTQSPNVVFFIQMFVQRTKEIFVVTYESRVT